MSWPAPMGGRQSVRHVRIVALVAVMLAGLGLAATARADPMPRRVLIAFVPAHETPAYQIAPPSQPGQGSPQQRLFWTFGAESSLSVGLLNAAQGGFTPQQAVLDMSQGTRVSTSTYSPSRTPALGLVAAGDGRSGQIADWPAVVSRAHSAPQTIQPGLFAQTVPGGAAYVATGDASHLDAVVAADEGGHVASLSIGPAASIVARIHQAQRTQRLVVADLPPDAPGAAALHALLAARAPGDLVLVMQMPAAPGGRTLMPIGMTGPPPARGLTSPTTTLPGLVAGIDIPPTALTHLGLAVPDAMRGQAIEARGERSVTSLLAFEARLLVIGGRRNPTLQVMFLAWAALLLALGAVCGWARGRGPGLRVGGLAFMWLPLAQLLGAVLRPASGFAETLEIVGCAFALAGLTDRLLPWPRGPMVPAFASIVGLGLDAGLKTHLLVQSILGPSPAAGSRFFGIGNELKSGLTCLLLLGLAAAFGPRPRSRRLAAVVAGSGVVLGVIIGSARLGAGVGGVIVVAAGVATATVLMLPGRPSRWVLVGAVLSPIAALALLAGVDLLTAGGQGHFVHNVLHVGGRQNLTDIVVRRTSLAYQGLSRGGMPLMIAVTALAVAFALRNRWLYGFVAHPMWRAALLGGLAAGVVGSFAEDSGPLLFVVAVFVLGAATAYGYGAPAEPPGPAPA